MKSPTKLEEEFVNCLVECDFCGVESEVPKYDWSTRCENKNCANSHGHLLVAPLKEKFKYIRFICKSEIVITCVRASDATFTCNCGREHIITDDLAEIRCKQPVYKAVMKVPIHEEIPVWPWVLLLANITVVFAIYWWK